MGQRHQIFVIARVQGRYRCIAAFHSQWLYGGMVVKTAARLIRAFVNPINAAIIASELAILEGLDTSVIAHENNVDHENPAVLCPYLTGLFLTCSRVDMDEGRMYDMSMVPVNLLPSQMENDDGYTCFDLTGQGMPQYCFWWPGTRPLTAYEYLSVNPGEDKKLAPAVYGILGHCALLGLETLAQVWPGDFRDLFEQWQHDTAAGESKQTSNSERLTPLPNLKAIARSAASAFDAIKETRGPSMTPEVLSEGYGLMMLLLIHLGPDAASRLRDQAVLASDSGTQLDASTSSLIASSELRSTVSAGVEMAMAARSSNPNMTSQDMVSLVESIFSQPENLRALRAELLEAKTLDPDDICRLKQLIAAEKTAIVDFKPWLSTGALNAATLLDFAGALQHAEVLDLSLSSTLTAEIVEAIVSRLPNLQHIIAFSCERLLPLTTALPITSYLTSLPVVDAIDQGRLRARLGKSAPECLRWVEASDPPAGLTIVMRCPPLSMYTASDSSTAVRRYGVELSHFGAEGVIRGFARYLERLYQPDYRPSESSCYFEMRAYFHSNGSVMLRECIPTHTSSSPTFSLGCLPSLIRDVSPRRRGQAYPAMTSTTASGAVTTVPRHPGWVLTLDTKGSMPYHRNRKTVDIRTLFKGGLGFFSPRERRPKGAERSKKTGRTKGPVSRPVTNDISPQSLPDQPGPSGASATSLEEPEDDSPTPRAQCIALPALDDAAPPAPGGTSTPTPNDTSSSPPRDGASTPTPKDTSSAPPRDGASTPTPKNATAPPREAPRPEYAFERWDVVPGQNTKELRVVERVSVREWVSRLPAGHGAVPEALLSECEAVLSRLNVALRGPPEEPGPVASD